MTAVAFDTLKLADQLQAGGFTAEQARTAASAFAEATRGADLSTKTDLANLATKTDLANLATKADLAEAKAEFLKLMIGAMIAQTGLIVALVKLIH